MWHDYNNGNKIDANKTLVKSKSHPFVSIASPPPFLHNNNCFEMAC